MSKLNRIVSRRNARLALVVLGVTSSAFAQTWTGAAGDHLFSTGSNWSTGSAPVSGSSIAFTGSTAISAISNIGTSLALTSATFSNSSTTGISGTSTLAFTGGIYQNGAGNVTITAPVSFGSGDTTIAGTGAGALILSNASYGGNSLNVATTGPVSFTGSGGTLTYLGVTKGAISFHGGQHRYLNTSSPGPTDSPIVGPVELFIGSTAGDVGAVSYDGGAKINNGIAVTAAGNAYAGFQPGTTGTFTFSDSGTVANFNRFGVFAGTGFLNIKAGAIVNTNLFEAGRSTVFGFNAYTTVTGTGSTLTSNQFSLSRGAPVASNADLLVDAGGTVAVTGTSFMGQLNDSVKVNVLNGSRFSMTSNFQMVGTQATGILNVNASTLVIGGTTFLAGQNGVFTGTIAGNSTVTAGQVQLGAYTGPTGITSDPDSNTATATLTVNHSSVTLTGTLFTGFYQQNTATLNVTNSSSLTGTAFIAGGTSSIVEGGRHTSTTFSGGSVAKFSSIFYTSYSQDAQSVTTIDGSSVTATGVVFGVGDNTIDYVTISNKASIVNTDYFELADGDNSVENVTLSGGSKITIGGPAVGTIAATGQILIGGGLNATTTLNITGAGSSLTQLFNATFVAADSTETSTINISNGGNLTAAQLQLSSNGGAAGGAGSILLTGGSTLTVNGGLFLGANGNLSATGGSLIQASFLTPGADGVAATIKVDASSLVYAPTVSVANRTLHIVGLGGTSTFSPTSLIANTITTGFSSTSAPTGLLDLTNTGAIDINDSLATVTAELAAYFNGDHTVGIGSSTAGALTSDPRDLLATLGVRANDDGTGTLVFATAAGLTLTSTSVIIKYTYIGDTDLNGVVNGADLADLLAGMNSGGTLKGWVNGDLNYDGAIDSTDLALLLNSLKNQGSSFGSPVGPSGAVPEPMAIAPVMGLALLAGRRRR